MNIPAFIMFAGFIFWLLAFPMDGILLTEEGGRPLILYFLFPHIAALYLLSFFLRKRLRFLADAGVILAGITTLAFPFHPEYAHVLLFLCGPAAAPVMIRMGVLLKAEPNFLKHIFLGLILGNLLTIGVTIAPAGYWAYVLTAICLGLSLGRPTIILDAPLKKILLHQPLIFVLYTLAGLMYGFLAPGYFAGDPLPGMEIFFYMAATFLAWYFFSRELNSLIYIAVALAILSQPALYDLNPLFFTSGIFSMQASMGFADFFVLALAISHCDPARGIGINSATLCLGIAAGVMVSMTHLEMVTMVAVMGNVALALSIVLLMVIRRKKSAQEHQTSSVQEFQAPLYIPESTETAEEIPDLETRKEAQLPARVTGMLSQREKEVLEKVLVNGRLYRDAAQEMGISESTVKTYMKRIYIKTGVKSRKDLDKLCGGR